MRFSETTLNKETHCIQKEYTLNPNVQYFIFSNYIQHTDINCTLKISLLQGTADNEGSPQRITLLVRDLDRITYTYDIFPSDSLVISLCNIWDLFITTYGTSGEAKLSFEATFVFIDELDIFTNPLLSCNEVTRDNITLQYEEIKTTNFIYRSSAITQLWASEGNAFNCGYICTQLLRTTLDDHPLLEIEYADGRIRTQSFGFEPYFILYKNAKVIRLYSNATAGDATVDTTLSLSYQIS